MVHWSLCGGPKLSWWGAVWAMLWCCGCGVVKFGEEFVYVIGHGYVNVAVFVVPFEGDSTVERTVPVLFEFVVSGEGADEVVGVFFGVVFDSKVINCEGELYRPCDVFP